MKKTKKTKHPESGRSDKKVGTWIIVLIVLFALLGLAYGYMMFKEFSGFEQQENGHFKKIENEN